MCASHNFSSNALIPVFAYSGCGMVVSTFHPRINRYAFHILLVKFRPCSVNDSSNNKSPPAGEHSNIPTRTPSAPYFSINSSGSGEFPSDFDILRRALSRTIPVKYTCLKGYCFRSSYPLIIIRATQKKIISCPVTNTFVG